MSGCASTGVLECAQILPVRYNPHCRHRVSVRLRTTLFRTGYSNCHSFRQHHIVLRRAVPKWIRSMIESIPFYQDPGASALISRRVDQRDSASYVERQLDGTEPTRGSTTIRMRQPIVRQVMAGAGVEADKTGLLPRSFFPTNKSVASWWRRYDCSAVV